MNNKIMLSLPSRVTSALTAFLNSIHINQTEVFFNGNVNSLKYIHAMLDKQQIQIYSLHMQKNLFSMAPEYIDTYLERAKKISEALNCILLFHPNGIDEKYINRLQRFPGKIAFENTICSYTQLQALLEKSTNFYLVYDIAHARYFQDHSHFVSNSKMLYAHIQGYDGENVALLTQSDETHFQFLRTLCLNQNCPFVLENSYFSYKEIIDDIKKQNT